MRSIVLQDDLSSARTSNYHGAEAVAAFSGIADEFAALRSHAVVCDLSWEAKFVCTGEDRVRWLNGMVTNNVRDLAPGRGVYSFVLNAQGHAQGDITVYNRGDYLLLVTGADQVSRLGEWLGRYIIMDDVELTNVSDKLGSLGVAGPEAASVLESAGLPVPVDELEISDAIWQDTGLSVVRGPSRRIPSYVIWAAPEKLTGVWDSLLASGAKAAGYETLELFRIASGTPAFGQDIRERELPQETGQDHALNFAKGCYIGQEIVERIRSRGSVHRRFAGFTLSETVPPGTKLQRDGKELGELTSVAQLPGTDPPVVALGYIRREAAMPGTELAAGSARAVVHALPFDI